MRIFNFLTFVMFSFVVAACSSNSSSDKKAGSTSDNKAAPEFSPSDLTVSGDDAPLFSGKFTPGYYEFRREAVGADYLLIASDNSIVSLAAAASVDQVELSEQDLKFFPTEHLIMNIMPIGVSMTVFKGEEKWSYTKTCPNASGVIEDCVDIQFDVDARSVTFINAELQAHVTTSTDEMSTGPIWLDGTIRWKASDEDLISSGGLVITPSTKAKQPQTGTPVALSDLQGTWAYDEDGDEGYIVVNGGVFTDYDYDGDDFGFGDNCYDIWEIGAVEDLGQGLFRVTDSGGVREIYIYKDSQKIIISDSFTSTYVKSDRIASDFVPRCD